jgi:hypothetical protein
MGGDDALVDRVRWLKPFANSGFRTWLTLSLLDPFHGSA